MWIQRSFIYVGGYRLIFLSCGMGKEVEWMKHFTANIIKVPVHNTDNIQHGQGYVGSLK